MTLTKERIRKELKKTYLDQSRKAWASAGMAIKSRMGETLRDNPKLDKLLKLSIIANVGIWGNILVNIFKGF